MTSIAYTRVHVQSSFINNNNNNNKFQVIVLVCLYGRTSMHSDVIQFVDENRLLKITECQHQY